MATLTEAAQLCRFPQWTPASCPELGTRPCARFQFSVQASSSLNQWRRSGFTWVRSDPVCSARRRPCREGGQHDPPQRCRLHAPYLRGGRADGGRVGPPGEPTVALPHQASSAAELMQPFHTENPLRTGPGVRSGPGLGSGPSTGPRCSALCRRSRRRQPGGSAPPGGRSRLLRCCPRFSTETPPPVGWWLH